MFRRTRKLLRGVKGIARELVDRDHGTPDIYSGGRYSGGTGYSTDEMGHRQDRADATPAPAGAGQCALQFTALDGPRMVAAGKTLLDAALEADLDLNHYCGGMASCGSCRVIVVEGMENLSPLSSTEEMTLDIVRESERDRLGCQCEVRGPVTVELPPQE